MNPSHVVSELTFLSYSMHRDQSPDITPERWARVFANVPEMEARYQAEKAIGKAKASAEMNDIFKDLL